jgi:hypothetical protein
VDAAAFGLLQVQLQSVLATLNEREAGVVRLRFGLTDGRPRTLDEIGRVYGVTRERIRQIEAKAGRPSRAGRADPVPPPAPARSPPGHSGHGPAPAPPTGPHGRNAKPQLTVLLAPEQPVDGLYLHPQHRRRRLPRRQPGIGVS